MNVVVMPSPLAGTVRVPPPSGETSMKAVLRSHSGAMLSGSGSIRIRSVPGSVTTVFPASMTPISSPFCVTRNRPFSRTIVSDPSSAVLLPQK